MPIHLAEFTEISQQQGGTAQLCAQWTRQGSAWQSRQTAQTALTKNNAVHKSKYIQIIFEVTLYKGLQEHFNVHKRSHRVQ